MKRRGFNRALFKKGIAPRTVKEREGFYLLRLLWQRYGMYVLFVILCALNFYYYFVLSREITDNQFDVAAADQELISKYYDQKESLVPILQILSATKYIRQGKKEKFMEQYVTARNNALLAHTAFFLPESGNLEASGEGLYWSDK
ncbi:MAG: hypothetical protein IT292_02705 [Deltaproteobacteria bacterium]|nr:hypothetical protein [Deltaproteobacteria bacterium]